MPARLLRGRGQDAVSVVDKDMPCCAVDHPVERDGVLGREPAVLHDAPMRRAGAWRSVAIHLERDVMDVQITANGIAVIDNPCVPFQA